MFGISQYTDSPGPVNWGGGGSKGLKDLREAAASSALLRDPGGGGPSAPLPSQPCLAKGLSGTPSGPSGWPGVWLDRRIPGRRRSDSVRIGAELDSAVAVASASSIEV